MMKTKHFDWKKQQRNGETELPCFSCFKNTTSYQQIKACLNRLWS